MVLRRPEVGRLLHDDHVANVRLVLDQQRRESPIGWNISLRPGLGQLIATTRLDQPCPGGLNRPILHHCAVWLAGTATYHRRMTIQPDDLLKASFFGPWVPAPGKPERVRHHYMSLAHWYESVKFMPAKAELRDSVLFCPSVKEARKFTKARQSDWRSDWNLVRHSVLIAGLGFLAIDRPDLGLEKMAKETLLEQLRAMKLPDRFVGACVDRFMEWAAGPTIASFGANTAPDSVVGHKISKTVANKPSWTLLSLCNGKAAWRLHDWALAHYVPVRYLGRPLSRFSAEMVAELVHACDQLVVFEVKGGRRADAVIKLARAQKKPLTLELYDAEDLAARSLTQD